LPTCTEIYLAGLRALAPQDMEGIRVMVTLGPTREHWDGLRFWTNPSTGTMGAAVAVAARLQSLRLSAQADGRRLADASGREERWAHLSKTDVAWRLLSWLLSR